jgi:hypothetical protein
VSSEITFPIFVGSGRSGTTLVQAIFSSHPQLTVVHESQFVPRLARRHHRSGRPVALDRLLHDLARNPDVARMGVDVSRLGGILRGGEGLTYPDVVRAVYAQYADSRGKSRYGDKTPGYVLHLHLLADLFPEARFVHVIRDGRDVALSYMQTRFGPRRPSEGALYWRDRVASGRVAGARLGADRYRELRYEDLLQHPEREVASLSTFLYLEFHPDMLNYFQEGAKLRAETADPSAHPSLTLPPTKGLRDWRRDMKPEDVAVFEALCGRLLGELGYERRFPSTTAGVGVEASAAWSAWQWKRVTTAFGRLGRTIRRRPSVLSLRH